MRVILIDASRSTVVIMFRNVDFPEDIFLYLHSILTWNILRWCYWLVWPFALVDAEIVPKYWSKVTHFKFLGFHLDSVFILACFSRNCLKNPFQLTKRVIKLIYRITVRFWCLFWMLWCKGTAMLGLVGIQLWFVLGVFGLLQLRYHPKLKECDAGKTCLGLCAHTVEYSVLFYSYFLHFWSVFENQRPLFLESHGAYISYSVRFRSMHFFMKLIPV